MIERKRIVKGQLREVPNLKHQHELDFLESLLTKESKVLEFGSGGSTIWFAKRVAEVMTCEDLVEWRDALSLQLDEAGLKNVNIFLHPHYHTTFCWEEGTFDLVYVDCYNRRENPIYPCVKNFHKLVKPGGHIVFGDREGPISMKCKALIAELGWRKVNISKPYQKCYWRRPSE